MSLRTCLILTIWTLLFVSVATAADRPGGYVDVRDFAPPEAKADGEFDWNSAEHPYIQDAIDSITHWQEHGPDWHFAHGTVTFGAGTYKTSKQIRLPGGLRMVGAGKRSTIILGQHADAAVINMKGASKCTLENLQIKADGPKTALLLGRTLVPNIGVPNMWGLRDTLSWSLQNDLWHIIGCFLGKELDLFCFVG